MPYTSDLCIENQTATRANHATLFVSLELSRSKWLVTSLSPGNDKMSKHAVAGGDGNALLVLLRRLAAKAFARVGKLVKITGHINSRGGSNAISLEQIEEVRSEASGGNERL